VTRDQDPESGAALEALLKNSSSDSVNSASALRASALEQTQQAQEVAPAHDAPASPPIVSAPTEAFVVPIANFASVGGATPSNQSPAIQTPPAAMPSVDSIPVAQQRAVAPSASDTALSALASALQDAKKFVSDNRQQIVQQINSRLQSSLANSQASTVRAATASDSGNGKTGTQDPNHSSANPPSTNPSAQDTSRQATVFAVASTQAHSDASSTANQFDQTADSAAATKAAGLLAASVEQSLHAPADAPAQSAGAGAGLPAPRPDNAETSGNPPPIPIPQPLPNSLGDVVKASELYQRVGGAEMHIAMQTDLLGSIDLRTVVHQSSLSATIGVQRADVQSLLANDLPALQHALADQKLHVEQISVLDNSFAGRMDLGSRSQQQQTSPGTHSPLAAISQGIGFSQSEEFQAAAMDLSMMGESAGLLSVRV